jgi:uncharacterized protein involved in exopolysaccharide biosynthesis
MARVMDTDMSSTTKAIPNKIMDSRTTGKQVVNSSRMVMEDRTRLTRMDTKKPTARRIDSMTNEANSDQVEEDMRSSPMDMNMQEMAMLVNSIAIPA